MVLKQLQTGVLGSALPFFSWALLPNLFTKLFLQSLYSTFPAVRPTTQAQSDLHQHRARAAVISGYLIYTLVQSIIGQEANFYSLLGLPLDVDSDDVPRAFRKLARMYHPDKVGPKGEEFFIKLRVAHDCLADSVKRFAYDRFGPDVMTWTDVITTREYMVQGLRQSLPFYIVNPIIISVLNWMNGQPMTSFWGTTFFICLASAELSLILDPMSFYSLQYLAPGLTPATLIQFLHAFFLSATLASRQLLPLIPHLGLVPAFAPSYGDRTKAELETDIANIQQAIGQVEHLAREAKGEALKAMQDELAPFRPVDRPSAATLRAAAFAAAKAASQPAPPDNALFVREPNVREQAWMHVFAEEVLTRRLADLRARMKAQGIATSEESKQSTIEATGQEKSIGEAASLTAEIEKSTSVPTQFD